MRMRLFLLSVLAFSEIAFGAENYIVCNYPTPESIRLEMPAEHITWNTESLGDEILGVKVEVSSTIDGISFHSAIVGMTQNGSFRYGYPLRPDSLLNEVQRVELSFLATQDELNSLELILTYDNEPYATCYKESPGHVYKAKAS